MVILSSRILEGVRRMDNILRQREPDQEGTGNPLPSMWNFPMWSLPIPKASRWWIMSLSSPPRNGDRVEVGPSGGREVPLAQLLLRFYEPQAGSIRIGGWTSGTSTGPAGRPGGLFQDSVLFTDTIENNIRMGNTAATMAEVEQAAKNAGIH